VIRPTSEVAVYLCIEPVDMRKQAATLALLIEQSLGRVVFDGGVYAFANRKRDRVKLLTWERNGLVLWSKRLEGTDRYVWPRARSAAREVTLSGRELNALLDGFDVFAHAHCELAIKRVG
jgi:transposase